MFDRLVNAIANFIIAFLNFIQGVLGYGLAKPLNLLFLAIFVILGINKGELKLGKYFKLG